jgi:hypothetical protein
MRWVLITVAVVGGALFGWYGFPLLDIEFSQFYTTIAESTPRKNIITNTKLVQNNIINSEQDAIKLVEFHTLGLGTVSEARDYVAKYGIDELTDVIKARTILLDQEEQVQVSQAEQQEEQVQVSQAEQQEEQTGEGFDFTSLYPEYYN